MSNLGRRGREEGLKGGAEGRGTAESQRVWLKVRVIGWEEVAVGRATFIAYQLRVQHAQAPLAEPTLVSQRFSVRPHPDTPKYDAPGVLLSDVSSAGICGAAGKAFQRAVCS